MKIIKKIASYIILFFKAIISIPLVLWVVYLMNKKDYTSLTDEKLKKNNVDLFNDRLH